MNTPPSMRAAVYRGSGRIVVEDVPTPALEAGEALVRVEACGVCGTDVKKVMHDLLQPPRIFGHETAGCVVAIGEGVDPSWLERRVAVYHHRVDPSAWYAQRGVPAQDPTYLETGATAGFEPAGGGYAEYVRVMPFILERGGLVPVPDHVPLARAIFVEPVNTCLKAIDALRIRPGDLVHIAGAGSIGLILMKLAIRAGARVVISDLLGGRRDRALELGAEAAPRPEPKEVIQTCRDLTEGRGADHAILTTDNERALTAALEATRPGATTILFAHTRTGHEADLDVGALCRYEKRLMGIYSSDPALDGVAAQVVFEEGAWLDDLVTHRRGLEQTNEAIRLAAKPSSAVCKVVVFPGVPTMDDPA